MRRIGVHGVVAALILGIANGCGGGGGTAGPPPTMKPTGPACSSTPAAPCFGPNGGTQALPASGALAPTLAVPGGQSGVLALTARISSAPPSGFPGRPASFPLPSAYLTLSRSTGPTQLTADATIAVPASGLPAGTTALFVLDQPDGASGAPPLNATPAAPIILAAADNNGTFSFALPFGAISGTFALAPVASAAPNGCVALGAVGYECLTPTSSAGSALALAIGVADPTAAVPGGSAAAIASTCSSGGPLEFSNPLNSPTTQNVLSVSANGISGASGATTTLASTIGFTAPVACDYLAPAVLYGVTFEFAGAIDRTSASGTPPVLADDWTTYAHDEQRTGLETSSGIVPANVASLNLAWRQSIENLDPGCVSSAMNSSEFVDEASPIVANGFVYVADTCGIVSALRRDTGDIAWQAHLPLATDLGAQSSPFAAVSGAFGTPTLDPVTNTLLVPVEGIYPACPNVSPPNCTDYAHGGYLAALDASSGAVRWEEPSSGGKPGLASGTMRGEPIVVGGAVIEGISGGDQQSGRQMGGLIALDEASGTTLDRIAFAPSTSPAAPFDGGSSWSPISSDGTYLYVGAGNTAASDGFYDGVLQVAFTGNAFQFTQSYIATVPSGSADVDEDVGGGALLWSGNLYFTGKTGPYYGYPIYAPSLPLFPPVPITTNPNPAGIGGIGTPTTDGTEIAAFSGLNQGTYQSDLDLFPVGNGTETCKLQATNSSLFSYVAWVPGIGFAGIDNGVDGNPIGDTAAAIPEFIAFNDGCKILWSANPTDLLEFFYAGPAVVASGLYAIDVSGNVYSWKLPTMVGIQARARHDLIRPGRRQQFPFRSFLPRGYGRSRP